MVHLERSGTIIAAAYPSGIGSAMAIVACLSGHPPGGSSATKSAKRFSGRVPASTRSTVHGLVYTTPASRAWVRVEPRVIMRAFENLEGGVKGRFRGVEEGGCCKYETPFIADYQEEDAA